MLKPNVMMALASKLEEEGITSSIDDKTIEAEVSASVEVSPEVQTQIDEAVTEAVDDIESMTETEDDLEEASEHVDDLDETATTLRAVVTSIRENGGVIHPQLYAFLQKSGYLDLIAQYQSNSITKVTYPAVEAMSTSSLNKQYSDSIIAGCESVIAASEGMIADSFKNLKDKVTAVFDKWNSKTLDAERKIKVLHDTLSKIKNSGNLEEAPYSKSLPSVQQIKEIAQIADELVSFIDGIDLIKNIFSKAERGDNSILEQYKENDKKVKVLQEKLNGIFTKAKNSDTSKHNGTIAGAGFTYDNLKNDVYKTCLKLQQDFQKLSKYENAWSIDAIQFNTALKNDTLKTILTFGYNVTSALNKIFNRIVYAYRGYIAAAGRTIKVSSSK